MNWTEIVEVIGLQPEIMKHLLYCAESLDRNSIETEIRLLSDPMQTDEAFQLLTEKLAPDEGNYKIELCEFFAAEHMYEKYRELGISDNIFFNTMAAFPRFINETKKYSGEWKIDRHRWSYRHVSMTIFRIGVLEYELNRKEGIVSIHIPSDSNFTPVSVATSLAEEKAFCSEYFPEFATADIVCHSWLLSDKLPSLLSENSNILRFQRRFRIVNTEHESNDVVRFLFQMEANTPVNELREETSLQKRVKELLMRGERIGTGYGILTDFS